METKQQSVSIGSLLLVLACVIVFSCKKDNKNPAASYGEFNLRLTDAPAVYQKVNVEIVSAEINHGDSGWISLPVKAGIYNLLDLQNGVSVALADSVKIPAGKINQLRLLLGTNNSVVTLTGVYDLKVPSGEETGLKINLDADLQANKSLEVVLDFDAGASVVEQGNASFVLKPVLKIQSVVQL